MPQSQFFMAVCPSDSPLLPRALTVMTATALLVAREAVTATDLATLEVTAMDLQDAKVVVTATVLATLAPLVVMTATDLETPEATATDQGTLAARIPMALEIPAAPTPTAQATMTAPTHTVAARRVPTPTGHQEMMTAPTHTDQETPTAPTHMDQETTTTHTDPRTRVTPPLASFWRRLVISSNPTT